MLAELRELLWTIGSANDAQDHGCSEEAETMRRNSCEGIRRLVAKLPFLTEALPGLQNEVDSGLIFGCGWSTLSDRLDDYVKGLGEE